MKHNHGNACACRVLLLFFLCCSTLMHGEDFTYDIHARALTPYVKEPILLTVDVNQTNPDVVLFFRFGIPKSRDYLIKQIDASHDDTLHHTMLHYRYLVYPLRSGEVTLHFDLVKRLTDEAKVAYSFSGDRDDFKKLETIDTHIPLPPITLHVRPLPPQTKLVGDFSIHTEFSDTPVTSYEPIPIHVTIKGSGYPPYFSTLIPKELNITHFDAKPTMTHYVAKNKLFYTARYTLALSAKKSFTLPQINIEAFNPQTKARYTLSIPSHHFTIKEVDVNTLVDSVDTPPPLHTDWQRLTALLGYLAAFVAGFATAWLFKWKRKTSNTSQHPLIQKIDAAKDKKTLLQLLMAHEPQQCAPVINKLEADLYGTQEQTLNSLKREAKELLT